MSKNTVTGKKKYLLIIGDLVILYFSLWVTLQIRYQDLSADLWIRHLGPFSAVFFIWIIIFFIDDLYELNFVQGLARLFTKLLRGTAVNLVIASSFFYFTTDRLFTIKPQRVLLIMAIIALALLFLWRLLFHKLARSPKITNNILIIGYSDLVKETINKISAAPQMGLNVKIILDKIENVPDEYKALTINQPFENLKQICIDKKISTIVTSINTRKNPTLVKNLFDCIPLKVEFYDLANFYEKITGKIPVKVIEQVWLLENLTESGKNVYSKVSRLFDIVISITLLVITIPFWPLIALTIKLTSKGPILFKQIRVGQDGKNFKVIKFRTMVQDAEKNGAQWATKNDARITPLGSIFRKTRIDELPQLINVIKGEMSLIGPRPERPEFVTELQEEIPFYAERLLVKPGLTGWAQVLGPGYGGSKEETLEKIQYDLYYIKNRSLALDLSITLKTIKTVLTRRGH